ncbi:MAG TPA: hypothetical protein VHG28_20925 [Longimicrobiaceae bacterium]|nr:hypothetical protein [Longimicrobiaceae bacterium]
MDLYVTFTGLCLFVRDRSTRNLHVLMPGTGTGAGGPHVEAHLATLDYPGGIPDLDMRDWALDLSGLGGTGMEERAPDTVVDVGALAGKGIDREQLGSGPRSTVASRITLPPRVRFESGETAEWTVVRDDGTRRDVILTHDVTCRVQSVRAGRFRWVREPLRGMTRSQELRRPRPMGDAIVLFVRHLPIVPSETLVGSGAVHFKHYFSVFKPPVRTAQLILKRPPSRGGSPFNCMLAQSESEGA